jgi:hypothetical protein
MLVTADIEPPISVTVLTPEIRKRSFLLFVSLSLVAPFLSCRRLFLQPLRLRYHSLVPPFLSVGGSR